MDHVVTITPENYVAEVEKCEKVVILDFTAAWCGPCKKLAPVLEEAAKESGGTVKVAIIDVDKNREIALKYQVAGLPTVVYVKNGAEVKRFNGLRSKFNVKSDLEQILA